MSLGWSPSDIALGIKLVGTAISALKESGGAATEFRSLNKDLTGLKEILEVLQNANVQNANGRSDGGNVDLLNQIAAHAQTSTDYVREALVSFNKFQGSLNRRSRWHEAVPRKLQWGFFQREKIGKLQSKISMRLDMIHTLQQAQQT